MCIIPGPKNRRRSAANLRTVTECTDGENGFANLRPSQDGDRVAEIRQRYSTVINRAGSPASASEVDDPNHRNWSLATVRRRIANDLGIVAMPSSLKLPQLLKFYADNMHRTPPTDTTNDRNRAEETGSSPPRTSTETVTLSTLASTVKKLQESVDIITSTLLSTGAMTVDRMGAPYAIFGKGGYCSRIDK